MRRACFFFVFVDDSVFDFGQHTTRTRSIMNFMNNETEAVAEVLVHEKRVIIRILTEKIMRDVLRSTVYSCRAMESLSAIRE